MKLPRDLSGEQPGALLNRYGYNVTRQTGSHIRLTSTSKGNPHNITIPNHKQLKIGTMDSILRDVAANLKRSKQDLQAELFG